MKRFTWSLAVILSVLLATPLPPSLAKDNWMSVRSRNFFLVGNASEKEIRQVATRLEQFRYVFTHLLRNVQFNSPVPTTVIVFKSNNSYKPFKPNPNVAGYFQPGEDVNYITLTTEPYSTEGPYRAIYHEYVHMLVNNTLGNSVPLWFNEGLAEYYSTFKVTDDRKVLLGDLISGHLIDLREQKMLPLRTLFAVDYRSPYYNEGSKMNIFYAESWILLHYLIQGDNHQRQPQLGRFLDLIAAHVPIEEAFQRAFQTSFEGMEKELKAYVQSSKYVGTTATFARKLEFDDEMQSAPIKEAEAQAYLGDLLLHTHRLNEAEARLQQALALDPGLPMAHASLGMLRVEQGRFAEAKQSLKRAAEANSQNYLTHYYYAEALSREAMGAGNIVSSYPPETLQIMRAELKKAIELAPTFPGSYQLLAFINLVANDQLDESLVMLKQALKLAPGRQELALMLAQVYLRKDDYKTARQILEPIARSSSSAEPRVSREAQMLLDQITKREEQLAQYKAAREADSTASDESQPRLRHRGEAIETETSETKTPPPTVDPLMYLQESLRRPREGEVRAQGMLVRIDCNAKGFVFIIRVGERLLKLQTESFERMDITTYTTDVGGQIGCGPRKPENPVVVTYVPSKDGRAKVDGVASALEFVPKEFKLK